MESIHLLIVDERRQFREVLRRLLERCAEFRVVGDVGGLGEAQRAVRDHKIDVAVLEYVLPGIRGLEMIRELKSLRPQLKILVLSGHKQLTDVARALAAGADGFLAMGGVFDELACAIHHVADGERYICPNIAHELALKGIRSETGSRSRRPAPALSI
jgi:DNA-binding NarL/FixJ family response regulator